MSINIESKPEMNVVNVGDELTQDQINAINAGASPATENPFITQTAGNAAYARLTADNTFTGAQAYNVNSYIPAFRISQQGIGEAFRVEDKDTPDTSPFVITADGRVGIQTTNVGTNALAVSGNVGVTGGITTTAANTFTVASGTTVPLTIQNNGTGNSFVVNDQASDTTNFVIDASGNIKVGGSITLPFSNLNSINFGNGASSTLLFANTSFTGGPAPSATIKVFGIDNLSFQNKYAEFGTDGIRFSDGTTQTTAAVSFDQSLNTDDSVQFTGATINHIGEDNVVTQIGVNASEGITTGNSSGACQILAGAVICSQVGYSTIIAGEGITFPDSTVQTTAYTGGGLSVVDLNFSDWDFVEDGKYQIQANQYLIVPDGGSLTADYLPMGKIAYAYFEGTGSIDTDNAYVYIYINGAGSFSANEFAMIVSVGEDKFHVIHTIPNN